jgi:hypothetical protein
MLNVIYDLRVEGTASDAMQTLQKVREECISLDAIVSRMFVIDDIKKLRPSRRGRKGMETKKASFVNQHDDEEKRFAGSFFNSVMDWESTKKDKSAAGFVVFVDVNSELMNIVLVNTTDNETTWTSRHGCLKDQYADDFADAHVTICEILKFMDGLGIVKSIEDRFEYYGKWDWNHALDKWQEITAMLCEIATRRLEENGDSVVIGGKWRVTRDKNAKTGYTIEVID